MQPSVNTLNRERVLSSVYEIQSLSHDFKKAKRSSERNLVNLETQFKSSCVGFSGKRGMPGVQHGLCVPRMGCDPRAVL